ncbi:MAG: hypothetical protein WA317_00585 [Mycobacterium sp.]|uniref:hypothetical protein n=1 Tax=Mycobacterium sp. TaxID=1785 RepID=UPI003CC6224B
MINLTNTLRNIAHHITRRRAAREAMNAQLNSVLYDYGEQSDDLTPKAPAS